MRIDNNNDTCLNFSRLLSILCEERVTFKNRDFNVDLHFAFFKEPKSDNYK